MNARVKHFSIITVLTLVSTVIVYFLIAGLASWGYGGLFERPFSASSESDQIETMFLAHFVLMGFLFSIIVVPLLYTVVVFRQEDGDDTDAEHIHGNTPLEIVWTVAPVFFVIVFAVWGVQLYNDIISPNPGEVVIRAQAYKWDWTFYYPELTESGADTVVANQSMVLEVGTPVLVEMQANDVIHAFWVPQFRVKQDVVPFNGSLTMVSNSGSDVRMLSFDNPQYDEAAAEQGYQPQELRFTPTEVGVYRLRCAEICGTQHWGMLANVYVFESDDYQAWLDGELVLPADPSFVNGQPGEDGFFLDELDQFCDEYGFVNCERDY